jgi:hypothetical protein
MLYATHAANLLPGVEATLREVSQDLREGHVSNALVKLSTVLSWINELEQ